MPGGKDPASLMTISERKTDAGPAQYENELRNEPCVL